ncbi:MAG TPA: NAD(P)-dependent oxidoreductase [Gammaproteobacteria bacterium]|nr:NAD(P)-dependent oxidoreductase [Gammaproteobacteria bacterium]
MSKVAFLGAGIMGSAMIRRLLAAGHELTVYNRSAHKAAPLVEAGAALAGSAAEAVAGADFVVSMVGDDAASRELWLGARGVLAGRPSAGVIAIEHSTLSHAWILALNDALAAAGVPFVDAPVTGGPDGAAAGALTVLAGAAPALLERARPLLDAYARALVHFGPPGAGTAYKLVVNLVATAQITALAEGYAIAERAGLDRELVAATLCQGTVASPVVKYLSERIVRGDHDHVYFATRWRRKDADYGLRLAAGLGQPVPTCEAAGRLFERAMQAGHGERNSSAIVEIVRGLADEAAP